MPTLEPNQTIEFFYPGLTTRRLYMNWNRSFGTDRSTIRPYGFIMARSGSDMIDAPNSWVWDELLNSWAIQDARNKALERFISAYQGAATANLGLSGAEGRESLELLTSRLSQLVSGFRSIARFDLQGARKAFGPPKSRLSTRELLGLGAKLHLEYIFGWQPLMADVQNTYDTIMSPRMEDSVFKGRGTSFHVIDRSLSDILNEQYGGWYGFTRAEAVCEVAAFVTVGNRPAADLNRYGLVNPLQVAFQAAPLSFVLNWFLPIEEGLSTLTDHIGYSISNPRESLKVKVTGNQAYYTPPPWGPLIQGGAIEGVRFTRTRALPSRHYPLKLKSNPLNLGKALSLVSILTSIGTSLRR